MYHKALLKWEYEQLSEEGRMFSFGKEIGKGAYQEHHTIKSLNFMWNG